MDKPLESCNCQCRRSCVTRFKHAFVREANETVFCAILGVVNCIVLERIGLQDAAEGQATI